MARRFFNKEYHFNTPRLERKGSDGSGSVIPTVAPSKHNYAIKAF
jgi:hypothetical protein